MVIWETSDNDLWSCKRIGYRRLSYLAKIVYERIYESPGKIGLKDINCCRNVPQ